MSAEKRNAVIYTQHGVSYHTAANPVIDFINTQVRGKTFNGSPHLGAGLIASQLKELGYNVDYKPIEDSEYESWETVLIKYKKVLFSAMDIQVDRIADVLEKSPNLQQISVVGGQGVTITVANEMSVRFPQTSFVVGRSENILYEALKNPGVHAGRPYNLQSFGSHPAMSSETTFRNDRWFTKSGMKLLELSTGCTQSCEICPIPAGEMVTYKDINVAIKEIEMSKMKPLDILVVVDHNLFNLKRDQLLYFYKEINKRGVYWAGEGTIFQAIDDNELLVEMGRNCISMLCGLEDIDGNMAGSTVKSKMMKHFSYVLEKVRRAKLPITWSLVFPLENHTPQTFIDTASFIKKHQINVNLHLIQPRSGSVLLDQLKKENRMTDFDSRSRDGSGLVYEPKNMSADTAVAGYIWLIDKVVAMAPERFAKNLKYGLRYASALAVLDITAVGMSGIRLKSLHSNITKEIAWYEDKWRKVK